ncbi:MAG TPA: PAS domain-containing protein [Marmoricola sp.]|nr:PAS domain-containing protein [Marmoricola sp.]
MRDRVERITSQELELVVELLDHLPSMVAYWDDDLRNQFANAAYVEWFGIAPEDMKRMHIRDLLGAEVYEKNLPYIKEALAGRPQAFNRTLTDMSGRTRYTQAAYVPRFIAGEPHGFFVLVTDITERVLAEQTLATSVADLALLEERQRVSADLHDIVIQTLYAAGMSLNRLSRELDPAQAEDANQIMDRIDEAIRGLRTAIRGSKRTLDARTFVADLTQVVEGAAPMLGFVPRLVMEGLTDLIPTEARPEILAVVQEALTNVAKHAKATQATVSLTVAGVEVRLAITDNGIGVVGVGRRSGLANLAARAGALGGSLTVHDNEPQGTILDWQVPSALARGGPRPVEGRLGLA